MATYRLEAKVISRAKGRSATASAAYRAGAAIEDERTGQIFDYTGKRGVLHSEIMAPANTPDWMLDRAALWNAVERIEQRRDAQLARDFILSLPHELTEEQRVELMRDFLRQEFVARGMIADFSIHAPDRQSDQRNHHCHVMVTMRELTGAGFGLKNRDWNKTTLLEQWRERWEQTVNRHLARHGHDERVDHRSLADQGIDREPEPKLGPVATEMERADRPSHAGDDRRAVQERNAERAALAREADEIDAALIMLDPNRPRGPAFEEVRQALEGEPAKKRRIRPGYADTDGGMVAQQLDAQRRFERNSEKLEARRKRADKREPLPAALDAAVDPAINPHEQSETPPMTSRHDQLRSEQSKAQLDRSPAADQEQHRGSQPPQPAVDRKTSPQWPMDQSMPAQNAAANAQAKGQRDANEARQNPDRTGAAKVPPEQNEQPQKRLRFAEDRDAPPQERQEQQAGRRLRFAEDRDVGAPDRAALKREQSATEPSRSEDGQRKLKFGRDGNKAPDLDR